MSSHIFPIKLYGLMNALHKTEMLITRRSPDGITDEQEDGLERIILFSSEVHRATGVYMNDDNPTFRKRLAYPPSGSTLSVVANQTAFEVYSVDGKLIASTPLCNLERAMSLAVEVELMSLILEGNGMKIEMV